MHHAIYHEYANTSHIPQFSDLIIRAEVGQGDAEGAFVRTTDVLVAGAGPAGCMAALSFARRGATVLV
ncbi:FAD-binding protein, partial [Streptomyces sp. UNOC14_S4]|uniref:FAD-binding protein n=1 Tax=Streptomyces sp. UNOC14_S4 TaxID=2872340 RepID=UPI0035AE1028